MCLYSGATLFKWEVWWALPLSSFEPARRRSQQPSSSEMSENEVGPAVRSCQNKARPPADQNFGHRTNSATNLQNASFVEILPKLPVRTEAVGLHEDITSLE